MQHAAIRQAKRQGDELALSLQVVQLGLGNGRAAFGAPDGRRRLSVGSPLAVQIQEGSLRNLARVVVDGTVGIAPVHRQPQALPQGLVILLGFLTDCQALPDESLSAHLPHRHAVALLNQPLGGQTVVIEAHRVEHVHPVHAEEARHEVRMAVGVHVAQVQVPRNGRRRGVDRIDRPFVGQVKLVRALRLPEGL